MDAKKKIEDKKKDIPRYPKTKTKNIGISFFSKRYPGISRCLGYPCRYQLILGYLE
jgi:hypothetical protein